MLAQPDIQQLLQSCMLADRHRLRRLHEQISHRGKSGKPIDQLGNKLALGLEQSQQLAQRRRQSLPGIDFPAELPVSQKRDDIAAVVAAHQVVIVAGETGSGKTTQLPKICLSLGRGIYGTIGHTQPRRIAARTVAFRIAEELRVPLGESVGYQVRFTDHSNKESHIKLMTDGILLAEIGNDRFLNRYDTLIIDEAHERSLNIDFLLGYIEQLLPKRPDLKVIITSATIDVERLSEHFDQAPIVQVSGRTYPVEVRYRPGIAVNDSDGGDEDFDLIDHVVATIEEILTTEPRSSAGIDDILVFLAGERDIRDSALAIRKKQFRHVEVLPLYARLSLAEQERVFQSHTGRRVVLATNVAETSVTVPGIRYVIDTGYARISRYSYRTKVLRLPIEAISQASANQRKGRCGRVSNGVCYRLYEESDFNSRPEFTEPEILRSNLASVILQMAQLRLGDIHRFPFVDVPDKRLVNDGYKLLEELQALDGNGQLTAVGRQLTQLTIDPRLARMMLAAQACGCVKEVLIIVSALTVQDPRERPAEKQQAADDKHRRFWDTDSDFLAFVKLWEYVEQQRQDLSQNQFRKLCQREFLSYLRLREWRELHHQLRVATQHLGLRENKQPADYPSIHRALVTGLLSNIGTLDKEKSYLGPRNRTFAIFPGSSQFKSLPKWIAAAELIETTKLYAHTVAKVQPEWLLQAAAHLVKRHYSEPHYEAKRGQVMAFERVTLYGLVLVDNHRVNFGNIDAHLAREIFIRGAFVEGRYQSSNKATAAFFSHNQQLLQETMELEAKSRRRDILVNDLDLYRFFDERIPAQVVNNKSFEHWYKNASKDNPKLLFLTRELVMQHGADDVTQAQFPDVLEWQGCNYPLSYHFEPSHNEDGVSIHVPLHNLHLLPDKRLQWLVPGLLREKCIALIKALPKQWRKHFVPVPDTVDRLLPLLQSSWAMMDEGRNALALGEAIGQALTKQTGVQVPSECWNDEALDSYYHFNIKVIDERGKTIESSRDLQRLRAAYRDRLQKSLREVGETHAKKHIRQWDFGELSESVRLQQGEAVTIGYPALVDCGNDVKLQIFDDLDRATFPSQRGVVRLLLLQNKAAVNYLRKNLFSGRGSDLRLAVIGRKAQLQDEVMCAAVQQSRGDELKNLPRTAQQFEQLLQVVNSQFTSRAMDLEKLLLKLADSIMAVHSAMAERENKTAFAAIKADIEAQLQALFAPGFLFDTPERWLQQYPRYIEGMALRIQKTDAQIHKDADKYRELSPHLERLRQELQAEPAWQLWRNPALLSYRWMVEEFRLSLFAQPMKTLQPVSGKRLDKQWEKTVESAQCTVRS